MSWMTSSSSQQRDLQVTCYCSSAHHMLSHLTKSAFNTYIGLRVLRLPLGANLVVVQSQGFYWVCYVHARLLLSVPCALLATCG